MVAAFFCGFVAGAIGGMIPMALTSDTELYRRWWEAERNGRTAAESRVVRLRGRLRAVNAALRAVNAALRAVNAALRAVAEESERELNRVGGGGGDDDGDS